jgi:hypothetical protein
MNRRDFSEQLGWSLGVTFFWSMGGYGCKKEQSSGLSKTWIEKLLKENDEQVSRLLPRQITEFEDGNYGGVPDQFMIFHPGSASGFIQRLTTSYVADGSAYFHDELLLDRMQRSIDFLIKKQHEDGTVDLLTTNFHSTPDTGFVVEPLALSYKLLLQDDQPTSVELRKSLETFLKRAGKALVVGGIHTPNHRWVVSMAMARIHELFPDPGYPDRIDQWLEEGIDIDGDGQFTERSTSVYSPLTDRCLITIAKIMGKPGLLDPVRKNLEMTLYYIHPNGEIATEASRRQDQYLAQTPYAYYYPYRYMSIHDQNGRFGSMVHFLEEKLGPEVLSGYLGYLLEDASIAGELPVEPLPLNYVQHFKDSDLVRIRRENIDATILAKNPALFTMQHGDAVLQAVRMSSAFFGKGQFVADELKVEEGRYRLIQTLEGPYYQPIAPELIASDGNWEKMPRDKRPQSEVQKMTYSLEIVEIEGGFQLDFLAEGTDHVPVAIELSFRKGGLLKGGESIDQLEDAYFMKDSPITYEHEGRRIEVIGDLHGHDWTQLRGAEPRIEGTSIYLTGYTPFKHKLTIRQGSEV